MTIAGEVQILDDAEALAVRAAEVMADAMRGCAAPYRLCLSGGSTPRAALRACSARATTSPGTVWKSFFGDERFVPHDNPDSNYRMAKETLLKRVHPRALLAMPTDGTPESCAEAYEEELRQQYGASNLDPAVPLFDLNLLGLGAGWPYRLSYSRPTGAGGEKALGGGGAQRPL